MAESTTKIRGKWRVKPFGPCTGCSRFHLPPLLNRTESDVHDRQRESTELFVPSEPPQLSETCWKVSTWPMAKLQALYPLMHQYKSLSRRPRQARSIQSQLAYWPSCLTVSSSKITPEHHQILSRCYLYSWNVWTRIKLPPCPSFFVVSWLWTWSTGTYSSLQIQIQNPSVTFSALAPSRTRVICLTRSHLQISSTQSGSAGSGLINHSPWPCLRQPIA